MDWSSLDSPTSERHGKHVCKTPPLRAHAHIVDLWLASMQATIQNWQQPTYASAGNRTPIDCLEGNHANHYTTDAHMQLQLAPRLHCKQMVNAAYISVLLLAGNQLAAHSLQSCHWIRCTSWFPLPVILHVRMHSVSKLISHTFRATTLICSSH